MNCTGVIQDALMRGFDSAYHRLKLLIKAVWSSMPTPKFKPGQSGNPKGRVPGNSSAALIRKAIAKDVSEIIKTLIDSAKTGDVQAAKILLDRVCPALKPQALPVFLPIVDSLSEQGNEIIKATMAGQIPPDIGSQLIIALSNQGKQVDLQEMAERLQRIEKQLANRQ